MSYPLSIVILLNTICFAFAQNNITTTLDQSDSSPVATAVSIIKSPQIDGDVLGDNAWENVKPLTTFWQTNPDEGKPASEQTHVRIAYRPGMLYFGIVCYDRDPKGIVVSASRRDASLEDSDSFTILLDTYDDNMNGFVFGTNPAGIEYDAQITNEGQGQFGSGGGGFNLNWDASWEVKTQITDIGWSAEFAIPFKNLRFSDDKEQMWGLNFQRNIRRKNENDFWTKIPRQYNIQKVSLAGSLSGLLNINQRNLKIMPYILASSQRDFEYQNDFEQTAELGFDVKYGITPSLTLDATYNTDFAQVEVDELQVNLDRFRLFFPEKRPFFLENAGFFGVGEPGEVELFFSRRIGIGENGATVPILGGGRISGQSGGYNIGLLNMQTKDVALDSIPSNNFTVARLSKLFPNRTAFGGIIVNRQGSGPFAASEDYNRTVAVDGRLGIGKYTDITGFAAKTITPDISDKNYAFNLNAGYNSPTWSYSASYMQVRENFNPQVGFLSRSGFKKPTAFVLYRYRPKNFIGILELRPHISYRGYWSFDDVYETGHWHFDNHWEWKNGYEFHSGLNVTHETVIEDFEIYDGVTVPVGTYDHKEAQLVLNTNEGAWWSAGFRSIIGGRFGGTRINNAPWLNVRIGETFTTRFILSRNDLDLPVGDFVTHLFQARISYSFTPRIFVQSLFQLNDKEDISVLNIRFAWQQSANTGLFLVYNDSRYTFDRVFDSPRFKSFVVKYSYLFDVL